MGQTWPEGATDHTTDDDLVARTLSGDRDAFGELWDRHHQRVYGYGMRRLGNRERAEDATAETFRRALTGLKSYRGGGFRSWLFAIAHSAVVDDVRASRPTVSLDDAAGNGDKEPAPDDRAFAEVELYSLGDLLSGLTPDQRGVIEFKLAGLSPSEIAAALGKSRPAVDMAYHRALIRLRSLLDIDRVSTGGL
jgi:RNA polymerase sigma-70 factor (ECF subfamily)